MQKKYIIIIAVTFYLMIMLAGGIAYFVLSSRQQEATNAPVSTMLQEEMSEGNATLDTDNTIENKEQASKTDMTVANKAEPIHPDYDLNSLLANVNESVHDGITFYTHDYEKWPPTGIYLRPFIVRGESCLLKNDVLYAYSIHDGQGEPWVHGDALDINADGQTFTIKFNPKKRHDNVSTGADHITENYVVTATAEMVNILRAVAYANQVTLYYYQQGQSGRSYALSRDDIRRVKEMVNLYDLLSLE